MNHYGCCDDEDDHDHNHNHHETTSEPVDGSFIIQMDSIRDPRVTGNSDCTVCDACDGQSSIPHESKVSRFRVANLCCAGEEKIIMSCLNGVLGIESVAVNIIGRYVIVKHCPVPCCAPGVKILDLLNSKHLGASIQEADGSSQDSEEQYDWIRIAHVLVVLLLFIIGLIFQFLSLGVEYVGLYLASTSLGVLPILYSAYLAIRRKAVDIHILMTIAVAGAIGGKEYFDANLVVVLLISAGLIESIAMMQVRMLISSSSASMAKEAYLSNGKKMKVEDLRVGHILAVRAGEMIMGDGVVIKGEGVVDESALTGESVPITKKLGAKVLSGTVVQNGFMEVELTSDFLDSTMSRLNQEVSDVQADKGEYAKLVDQFAVYWTPGVIVGTLIFVVVGGAVTNRWIDFAYRGLVLLVLACPCAIVISAPIPSVCSIAIAAKYGVLIRGSSVVERISTVNTLALDKTGTLTKGFFKVGNQLDLSDDPDRSFNPMELAAAIEQKSTHPLANAIVAAHCGCVADMVENDIQLPNVRKVVVTDGVGVSGWAESEPDSWQHVAIGNERLFKSNGGKVHVSPRQELLLTSFSKASHGKVVLMVAVDDELQLIMSLSDELRPEAASFVEAMKDMNMSVSMLTGDQEEVAADVCKQVGISATECHPRLLPRQKYEWIEERQTRVSGARNRTTRRLDKVIMVGDGINDSTALSAAAVGVAMGAGGSAMAVASADVILMTDDLMLIPATIDLCHSAYHLVIQNFVFSIAVKVVAIVLALMGRLLFWEAVLVDIGTLLAVLANGIRPLFKSSFATKLKQS